ncbi:MAG: glycogen/starch synthase [Salinivirgaceae bacterium]|jgi:starch synthase|nr:glycogen/starch synthase [Salinivirgaceae bacterium]MBR3567742.1 glycogen/starch synthase [Salinivirgaceae bacterium]MBR4619689.1 glycogen/starch synthase [Salinivirgaceae bacterium]
MEKKKVLFVSQEITPYLPETEISKISRELPQGIQERGKEIRTFMPRYGCVNERRNQLHEVIRLTGMNLIIDDTDHPLIIKVASIQSARMQVYFIDNEDYFQRKATLKSTEGQFFEDNDERAMFFARGVLETVQKLRWSPDIIHCHGWFTSFVPIYVKRTFRDNPLFSNSKVIMSLYDNEFDAPLNPQLKNKLIYDSISEKDVERLTNPTYENLSKFAIDFSDGVIFGSQKINDEVANYAKSTGKPVLDYQSPETYMDAFNEFYEKF